MYILCQFNTGTFIKINQKFPLFFTTGGELVKLDGFAVEGSATANASLPGRISYNIIRFQ